jgi:hypothetical protein
MATDSQHTLKRKRLGQELRRLREGCEISRNSAAAAIKSDASKISRMELARAYVSPHDLAVLCNLYDVPPQQRFELERLLVGKRPRHWWREYSDVMSATLTEFVALEDDAVEELEYQPMVVCGLLQTQAYTEVIMGAGYNAYGADQIESLTAVRQNRQRRLVEEPVLAFHGIITEAALNFSLGGPQVMAAQFAHLVEMASLPNVTLQVVPFSAGRSAAQGAGFVVLKFADPVDSPSAFMDAIGGIIPRDTQRDIRRCDRLFGQIRTAALAPEDSLALILERAESLR